MVASGTALVGLCLVLAMLTAAGCVQVNEAVNSRDLECTDVPEDLCTTTADHFVTLWDPESAAESGPLVKFHMRSTTCVKPRHPDAVRCWAVEAHPGSGAGIGGEYYQNVDGRIFDEGGVPVGN